MARALFYFCLLMICSISGRAAEPNAKPQIPAADIRLAIPEGFKAVYSPAMVGGAPIHTYSVQVDCYKTSRWGFINGNGEVVIRPQWEDVGDFFNNRAAVNVSGKIGFIDPQGRMIIQPRNFSSFLSSVMADRGVLLPDFRHGVAYIDGDQYIDTNGNPAPAPTTKEPDYPMMRKFRTQGFTEGLASTVFEVSPDVYRIGFIDMSGNFVIKPIYYGANPFHEGLASFQPTKEGPWGYLDHAGKTVISPAWERAEDFSEGLAVVENKAHLHGCIDHSGKVVIPFDWNYMGYGFTDGVITVIRKGREGVINRQGKLIVPTEWDKITFQNGYSFAVRLTEPMRHLSETSPPATAHAAAAWYNPDGKMIWHTP